MKPTKQKSSTDTPANTPNTYTAVAAKQGKQARAATGGRRDQQEGAPFRSVSVPAIRSIQYRGTAAALLASVAASARASFETATAAAEPDAEATEAERAGSRPSPSPLCGW